MQGSTNDYWRRDQVFGRLDACLASAFRSVHDIAEHGGLSLRGAAYLLAVEPRGASVPGARMGVTT
jgi:glutamate dehydrogenase/leucine dehydrogenase